MRPCPSPGLKEGTSSVSRLQTDLASGRRGYLTLPLQRRMPFNFSFFGEIFEELWVNSSSLTFGSQMPVKCLGRSFETVSRLRGGSRASPIWPATAAGACRDLVLTCAYLV